MLHWLPICPNYRCEYYPPTSSTMMINYQRWQLMYLARSHNLTLIVYHLSFLFVCPSYLSLFLALSSLFLYFRLITVLEGGEQPLHSSLLSVPCFGFPFFLSVYSPFSLISLYASLFVQKCPLIARP